MNPSSTAGEAFASEDRSRRTLEGRVALVSGASRGIGAAVAHRLAAEGASVAAVARTREEGDFHLAGSLCRTVAEATGGRIVAVPADLSSPDTDHGEIVRTATDLLGAPVDILINNAAAAFYPSFLDITQRRLRVAIEVNVMSPFAFMQAVLPDMLRLGRGWIVNISSQAAVPPTVPQKDSQIGGAVPYGGTKAMLERITVGAAADLYGKGVAINALRPTATVRTEGTVALVDLSRAFVEPMESMCEAVLALTVCPPDFTGRVVDSLHLIMELGLPVRDLDGKEEIEGWQPMDIPAQLAPFAGP